MKANQHPVEKLILGTVQLGLNYGINNTTGKPSEQLAFELLDYAKRNGIRYLDSAENYGTAHEVIGKYSEGHSPFQLYSKFTLKDGFSVLTTIEKILEVTHLPSLAGISFHRYEDLDQFKNWSDLKNAKKNGLIKDIGVSIYNENQFKRCIDLEEVTLIQIPFNLLDHSPEKIKLMASAKARGIKLHVRSVFLQGVFFKDPAKLPAHLSEIAAPLSEIRQIAEHHSVSVEQLALAFPYLFDEIDGVLIGVETLEQLEKNLTSLHTMPDLSKIKNQILAITTNDPRLLDPSQWNTLEKN